VLYLVLYLFKADVVCVFRLERSGLVECKEGYGGFDVGERRVSN
jgi:hypothetical protein